MADCTTCPPFSTSEGRQGTLIFDILRFNVNKHNPPKYGDEEGLKDIIL